VLSGSEADRQRANRPAGGRLSAGRPELSSIDVTLRAAYAYVTGTLTDGEQLPLCRLRYGGSASIWGFSIYRASHDSYQPSVRHTGMSTGTSEEALDTACGLYLNDPTAWTDPPKN